jgi:hypothetical protein
MPCAFSRLATISRTRSAALSVMVMTAKRPMVLTPFDAGSSPGG